MRTDPFKELHSELNKLEEAISAKENRDVAPQTSHFTRSFLPASHAFALIELLIVLAIIGILATLLLPVLSNAKANTQRASCLNNIRQIDFGLRMYADDSNDKTPRPEGTSTNRLLSFTGYKHLIQSYVGASGTPSPKAKLFACPADRFFYTVSNGFMVPKTEPIHDQSFTDFASYGFNGGNLSTNLSRFGLDVSHLGIAGRTIGSIRDPVKTVLLAEAPAFRPYSWHEPKLPLSRENDQFKDAKNMVGFVDGHVSYIKIFWTESITNGLSLGAGVMNPPPGYDYQWSGD